MDKVKLVFRMNFQGCEILPYCIINHCGVFRHLVSFHTSTHKHKLIETSSYMFIQTSHFSNVNLLQSENLFKV